MKKDRKVSEEKMKQSQLWKELEAEAQELEQKAMKASDPEPGEAGAPIEEADELPQWDEQTGFADLMARMERGEQAQAPGAEEIGEAEAEEKAPEQVPESASKVEELAGRKPKKIRWRLALVFAAVLVLTFILSVGTFGEKVYVPEAVTEHRDGEVVIKIDNKEVIERDVEEEEIYREIEERLGILAIRLGYKPDEMELYKVEIIEGLGEARLLFLYKEQIFRLYIKKAYADAGVNVTLEGNAEKCETVECFWLNQEIQVWEQDNKMDGSTYLVEFVEGNASYFIDGMIEKEIFLKIIEEIYVKNA